MQPFSRSDQNGKRQKKLGRSEHPEKISCARLIAAQRDSQQPCPDDEDCGLPKMVDDRRRPVRMKQSRKDHRFFPFLISLSIFSASFTSSSDNFPESIRWAMIG